MDVVNILYIITAAIFVLFIPGFSLSFVFFELGKIDILERIALSFALSISVIPLLTFYLNLLGLKINVGLVVIEVIVVCLISTLIVVARKYVKK